MRAPKPAPWRVLARSMGLALASLSCLPASHAQCRVVNPGLLTPAGAILSSGAIRFPKDARTYRYVFSMKCSGTSRYRLSLAGVDLAQPPGTLLLSNPKGDRIVVRARLKSVGGADVNVDLGALPGGRYEGSIAAEQSQEVVLELLPVDVKPRGAQASGGDYQGVATIRLDY
ncbi:hypothetical protein QMO14_13840 [Variovorax sp. CAN2819]|uniref:hypothetical protein n=1 Tax=Variovorax sp. CAN15 TaxID=3046727 RepID=UPI002649CB1E|nr:hypothetical protein [Variovorax sp. CAN15]MDN6884680.1 hypothetical protein [Variovorax sp. CAN15]